MVGSANKGTQKGKSEGVAHRIRDGFKIDFISGFSFELVQFVINTATIQNPDLSRDSNFHRLTIPSSATESSSGNPEHPDF